jgi:hypothetical protein
MKREVAAKEATRPSVFLMGPSERERRCVEREAVTVE